jgi:hypothetical protein
VHAGALTTGVASPTSDPHDQEALARDSMTWSHNPRLLIAGSNPRVHTPASTRGPRILRKAPNAGLHINTEAAIRSARNHSTHNRSARSHSPRNTSTTSSHSAHGTSGIVRDDNSGMRAWFQHCLDNTDSTPGKGCVGENTGDMTGVRLTPR